ncbi:MAG: sulfatase-like hydrolase/transferase [Myxococcota bacterium]|nr:sulfatase-like hydrolase/transferase [Myxococcota bacterium]
MSLLLLSALACQRDPTPDVVLVTWDTTRADRLSPYGGPVPTPALQALADRGTRFELALSPTPLTGPAHASILSGLEPQHHGVHANGTPLSPEVLTLGEVLGEAGWTPLSAIGAFVTHPQFGLHQGFTAVDAELPQAADNPWRRERSATQVLDAAFALLDEHPEPVFLWVHLYDPHAPYEGSYNAELERVDAALSALVQRLGERPADTLWLVVGDHGEGLGDGTLEQEHGLLVDPPQVRVPWVMAGPGVPQQVVSQPVGLADLMPTLLSALQLPIPAELDGAPQPGNPRPLRLQSWQLTWRYGWEPHRALVHDSAWLSVLDAPTLTQVPDGAPLQDPTRLAELQVLLGERGDPPHPQAVDPTTQAALLALGYLSPPGPGEDTLAPIDLEALALLEQASAARMADDLGAELEALATVTTQWPELREGHARLMDALSRAGRSAAAREAGWIALEHHPSDARLHARLASLHGRMGDHTQALALAEQASALDPSDRLASELQVQALLAAGDRLGAAVRAQQILAQDPEHARVAGYFGLMLARDGNTAAALPYLEQSAAAGDPPVGVRTRLSQAVAAGGNPQAALALLDAELARYPGHLPALEGQWWTYTQLGRPADALQPLAALRAARPDNLVYVDGQVRALLATGAPGQAAQVLAPYLALRPEDPRLQALDAQIKAASVSSPAPGG